ncbi:MAG: LytR/AlgR family response regulator transcription factor [Muribaculaceae bacterium]
MKTLRCIVADDEPLAVELLRSYVQRDERLELVGAFTDARAALATLQQGGVDLAILDIQMPLLSGIEIARAADEMGVRVMFVTAYREYALDGFRVHAADYLLKPVSRNEFAEAIDRICSRQSAPVQYLTVRSDYRQVRLPFNEILYVEGLKDYVKIYVTGRERPVITQMSLKAVEQALPADEFVRIHRSFVVAKSRVTAYDRSSVTVAGTALPIGDTYRQRVSL